MRGLWVDSVSLVALLGELASLAKATLDGEAAGDGCDPRLGWFVLVFFFRKVLTDDW